MPFTQDQLKAVFGTFLFREDPHKKGAIIIDPGWVSRCIKYINTPYGRFPCHTLVAHQMQMFINQGCAEGLINDIGGAWVPRHILWNPTKPLSGHAYGCDIDINVDDGADGSRGKINYGTNSYQPERLVELAKQWGFEWGGAWRTGKDGMHFSCVRIIQEGDQPIANSPVSVSTPPAIRRGSRGDDVKDLQRRLNERGFSLVIDGIFGPKTQAALTSWQKRQGIRPSGVADAQTWASLGRG